MGCYCDAGRAVNHYCDSDGGRDTQRDLEVYPTPPVPLSTPLIGHQEADCNRIDDCDDIADSLLPRRLHESERSHPNDYDGFDLNTRDDSLHDSHVDNKSATVDLKPDLLPQKQRRSSCSTHSPIALAPSKSPSTEREKHGNAHTLILSGWPRSPQMLSEGRWELLGNALMDFVVIAAPVTFLVLAFGALSLNGKLITKFGQNVFEAQKLGPTLFPILFAGITGRLMTSMARWKAERGSRLGTLEQLIGSQSLSSALERAVCLRNLNLLGLGVVLLWSISPFGGQSALRLLSTQTSLVSDVVDIRYLCTNANFANIGASAMSGMVNAIAGYFGASLLASPSVRRSPVDAWGNVKIPLIDRFEHPSICPDDQGWLQVGMNPSTTAYSSLLGLIIVGIPPIGLLDFSVESTYLSLFDCYMHRAAIPLENKQLSDSLGLPPNTQNLSSLMASTGQSNSQSVPFYGISTGHLEPLNFIFVKYEQKGTVVQAWNCSMESVRVESLIHCEDNRCAVTQIRRSRNDTRPADVLPFDGANNFKFLAADFTRISSPRLTLATQYSDPFVTYLQNATSIIYQTLKEYNAVNHDYAEINVDPDDFAVRLTQLWNTYLQLVWSNEYTSGGAPTNISVYGNQTTAWHVGWRGTTDDENSPPFPNNATTARVFRDGPELYVAHGIWIGILSVTSFVLLACGIASTFIRNKCSGPNILGYVSSLTRDNPHLHIPSGGTALGGLDRARLLKNIRVQIGDTREAEETGHIAIKDAGGPGSRVGRDKTRRYL